MALKKSNIVPSRKLIADIDETMPKLKYSVPFGKIVRWLENFEEHDFEKALDFLFFLEYIDYHELNVRMDEQLSAALNEIPKNHKVIIYPCVASYPKSTEVINYILKETPSFKRRAKDYHCVITRDLEKEVVKTPFISVILVDDFIGTGKSFKKGYVQDKPFKLKLKGVIEKLNLREWLDHKKNVKHRYLISALCMNEGARFINQNFNEIIIKSEFRSKLFDETSSPFRVSRNIGQMKSLAEKYGKLINTTSFYPFSTPLGFNKCEALIAFSHTTPNNTLPIIWGGGPKWFPIFPRLFKDKAKQSKALKSEVAFYIGIMNRLGIDLYTKKNNRINGRRTIKDNNDNENHALLCVIKLLVDGFETPSICQILGITTQEYRKILSFGKKQKLINTFGGISNLGRDFYSETLNKISSSRFRKKDKGDFEMKNKIYVPKRFRGVT